MTVVWWYLRLYCPSLVAWKYIGRFLGKKFFVFWFLVLGSKQNKKLPYIHTFYHNSRIFMAGFQWNHFSSQKKADFYFNFSEIRRIVSTWRPNISSSPSSVLLWRLLRFRASPPSQPQTALETLLLYTSSVHDIYRHHLTNTEDIGSILSLYVSVRPLWKKYWKLTESYPTCVTGLL